MILEGLNVEEHTKVRVCYSVGCEVSVFEIAHVLVTRGSIVNFVLARNDHRLVTSSES